MAKKLKVWNGRSHGHKYRGGHFYVAAHSQKEAAELISKASNTYISVSEIRNYYSDCWGNPMQDIQPLEPSLYFSKKGKTPQRIL